MHMRELSNLHSMYSQRHSRLPSSSDSQAVKGLDCKHHIENRSGSETNSQVLHRELVRTSGVWYNRNIAFHEGLVLKDVCNGIHGFCMYCGAERK